MPRRHRSFTPTNGSQELAAMRRALRQAEDDLAGLHRMLRVATPKGGRRTIKSSRSGPSPLERIGITSLGHGAADAILSGGDVSLASFAPSNAQIASQLLTALSDGERVG